MNEQNSHTHDDLLERATQALQQTPVPTGPPCDLVADVVAHLNAEEAAGNVRTHSLFARIKSMKPVTKLTVVATLAAVFSGVFAWLSPGGQVFALEKVASAMESIRSATCDMTSEAGGVKSHHRVMFLAPSLERIETKAGDNVVSITVADMRAKKWLSLMPQQKLAMVLKMDNAPANRPMNGSIELIRQRFRRAGASSGKNSESLGEKVIDGVPAIGFRLEDRGGFTDVWAHRETALPVHVETTVLTEPKIKTVMTNFQYDVELDTSLFSFDPPDDYNVQESSVSLAPPSMKDLADMLRFAATNNDSVFPEEITGAKGVHFIMHRLLNEVKAEHGQDSAEWKSALVRYSTRIARGSTFVMTELAKSDWHYQGDGIKIGDDKAAIFWYRPKDGDSFQVLYGDFRIESSVDESELPKRLKKD